MTSLPRRWRPIVVALRRSGFTLVEMIVVLIVLGLAATLAAPMMTLRQPSDAEALGRVVDLGRQTAIRRAEAVVLDMAADGRWSLRRTSATDGSSLASDSLTPPPAPLTVHFSPLGICVVDRAATATTSATVGWDALSCVPGWAP